MATIYKNLWLKKWRETHSARTNKKLLNRWPWYWATEQLLFRAKKIDFAFSYSTFLRVCTDGATNWWSNESNHHLHVNNNKNRRVSNGHSFWPSETVYLLINISPHSFINLTVSDALYFLMSRQCMKENCRHCFRHFVVIFSCRLAPIDVHGML